MLAIAPTEHGADARCRPGDLWLEARHVAVTPRPRGRPEILASKLTLHGADCANRTRFTRLEAWGNSQYTKPANGGELRARFSHLAVPFV